jgi:hypothetical protein
MARVRLYRNASDLQHWFVRIPGPDWLRFPAKFDGWAQRQTVNMLNHKHLNPVPLWLAFNTGLLEAIERRDLDLVA